MITQISSFPAIIHILKQKKKLKINMTVNGEDDAIYIHIYIYTYTHFGLFLVEMGPWWAELSLTVVVIGN